MGRRMVKTLYVDDEAGVLVADCEGGAAVIGPVLNSGGRVPAAYVPGIEEVSNPLPTAGPAWLGRMVRIMTEEGDEVWVCIMTEDGNERWRKVRLTG